MSECKTTYYPSFSHSGFAHVLQGYPGLLPLPQQLKYFLMEISRIRTGLCSLFAVAAVPILLACTIEGSFLWSSALPLICFMHTTQNFVSSLFLRDQGFNSTYSYQCILSLTICLKFQSNSSILVWYLEAVLFCFAISEPDFVFLFLQKGLSILTFLSYLVAL